MSDAAREILWQLLAAPVWQWACVLAVISFAVWLTFRIRTAFGNGDDPAADERLMLVQFDELRREGDLTDEEFRLISRRLVGRRETSGADTESTAGNGSRYKTEPTDREDDSSATTIE